MQRNKVLLVDENDLALGEMNKIEAHIKGVLHRAFSIFILNTNGEMLIHQRAAHKYHGALLWTNACCSHPQLNENIKESALQRLSFEMGMQCDINEIFSFIYKTPVENNFIEHELDHVFIGVTDACPNPNKDEVQQYRWVSIEKLLLEIEQQPQNFTFWFKQAIHRVLAEIELHCPIVLESI